MKSRLEEWLESYGITRETQEVRGATEHVGRVRGAEEQGGQKSEMGRGVRRTEG